MNIFPRDLYSKKLLSRLLSTQKGNIQANILAIFLEAHVYFGKTHILTMLLNVRVTFFINFYRAGFGKSSVILGKFF